MSNADFVLVSHWRIPAAREAVWEALKHPVEWPQWWPFVRAVDELAPGAAVHRLRSPRAVHAFLDTTASA